MLVLQQNASQNSEFRIQNLLLVKTQDMLFKNFYFMSKLMLCSIHSAQQGRTTDRAKLSRTILTTGSYVSYDWVDLQIITTKDWFT